ncbi:MAG: hypothetical protein AAGK97_14570, partial [Bacteroidota bacterium]
MKTPLSAFVKTFLVLITLFSFLETHAQLQAPLLFKPEVKTFETNIDQFLLDQEDKLVSDFYFKLIQFESVPLERQKNLLTSNGLHFISYIPNYAYLVRIPANMDKSVVAAAGVKVVKDFLPEFKIDHRILSGTIPDHGFVNGKFRISIVSMDDFPVDAFKEEMLAIDIAPYSYGNDPHFAYADVSRIQIDQLAN